MPAGFQNAVLASCTAAAWPEYATPEPARRLLLKLEARRARGAAPRPANAAPTIAAMVLFLQAFPCIPDPPLTDALIGNYCS